MCSAPINYCHCPLCNNRMYISLSPSNFLPLHQASATVAIPKEHHRFVIGKNGEKLQELELKTATKIAIPRPDDPSANIRITGTKEGIEKARHEILLISAEQVGHGLRLRFTLLPLESVKSSSASCKTTVHIFYCLPTPPPHLLARTSERWSVSPWRRPSTRSSPAPTTAWCRS